MIAGKAHPNDSGGKDLIRQLLEHARRLEGHVPVVFLANYDMGLAARLISGCDVWLNTPLPPLEASGTSGMKAALNGVINVIVLDGWWIEAWDEGITGWAIGDLAHAPPDRHASFLYQTLETAVLPLYADDRPRWIWMMKQAISRIGSIFNSQRMMRRYASEAYLR